MATGHDGERAWRRHRVAGPGLCVAASCLSSSKGFGEGDREALGNRIHQLSSSRGSGGTGKRGAGDGSPAPGQGCPATLPTVKEPLSACGLLVSGMAAEHLKCGYD